MGVSGLNTILVDVRRIDFGEGFFWRFCEVASLLLFRGGVGEAQRGYLGSWGAGLEGWLFQGGFWPPWVWEALRGGLRCLIALEARCGCRRSFSRLGGTGGGDGAGPGAGLRAWEGLGCIVLRRRSTSNERESLACIYSYIHVLWVLGSGSSEQALASIGGLDFGLG